MCPPENEQEGSVALTLKPGGSLPAAAAQTKSNLCSNLLLRTSQHTSSSVVQQARKLGIWHFLINLIWQMTQEEGRRVYPQNTPRTSDKDDV